MRGDEGIETPAVIKSVLRKHFADRADLSRRVVTFLHQSEEFHVVQIAFTLA